MEPNYLSKRIGIIGGGQLGQMMALEAKKMGFYLIILDPTPDCPAHSIVDEHIVAGFDDPAAIRKLAENCDLMTYEFEHINTQILLQLENEGYKIYPTAKSLKIIQNKLTQKETLAAHALPVPDFMGINNKEDMLKAGEIYGYPYMLKTCTGGYDGKGNAVSPYGKDIVASNSMYLMPRITYWGLKVGETITLNVRLYDHEGKLVTGTSSPAGYSFSCKIDPVLPGENSQALSGWGGADKGHFKPGSYRYEVWYENVCLQQLVFSLK